MSSYFTNRSSAFTSTAETVVPFSSARALAALHSSSGTRTVRTAVLGWLGIDLANCDHIARQATRAAGAASSIRRVPVGGVFGRASAERAGAGPIPSRMSPRSGTELDGPGRMSLSVVHALSVPHRVYTCQYTLEVAA